MPDPGLRGYFMGNGPETVDQGILQQATLYHLDFNRINRLIVCSDHPVKYGVRVYPLFHQMQEIAGSDRRPAGINFNINWSQVCFKHHSFLVVPAA
jgi:hypothetical protein